MCNGWRRGTPSSDAWVLRQLDAAGPAGPGAGLLAYACRRRLRLPAVAGQDSSKLWVTAPDPHPNAYANGLYAEFLYPALKALLPTP